MELSIFHVDAFTDVPFAGNPAAVCILPEPRDDKWMQNVAREMNLSETAFLLKGSDGFRLRWFTPAYEVDLCGHATLASSHVLWERGILKKEEIARFHTRSGLLTAQSIDGWIELDFPALPERKINVTRGLSKALGSKISYLGKSRFDYLAMVKSEREIRQMKPNFSALAALPIRGLIVTAKAQTKPYDFVSRFFCPQAGMNEDPVTGSAHCCLGPFWKKRLNKDEFLAYQASPRGGEVRVRVADKRVHIAGKAVTVAEVNLL